MVYIEALIMEVNPIKVLIWVLNARLRDTGQITGLGTARSAAFIGSGGTVLKQSRWL